MFNGIVFILKKDCLGLLAALSAVAVLRWSLSSFIPAQGKRRKIATSNESTKLWIKYERRSTAEEGRLRLIENNLQNKL